MSTPKISDLNPQLPALVHALALNSSAKPATYLRIRLANCFLTAKALILSLVNLHNLNICCPATRAFQVNECSANSSFRYLYPKIEQRLINAAQSYHKRNMFNQPVDSARELLTRYSSGERVFKGACLERVNLQGACLESVSLIEADLVKADLRGANLREAHLEGSDLRNANLEGAHLEGSHLEGANLEGANLQGANLDGAVRPNGRARWR